jgi:hypothetical protein
MSRDGAQILRYQICDEPKPSALTRFAIPPLLLMPITIFLAVAFSPLFWLLPAANAMLLNGVHKWREAAFSLLSLVVFVGGLLLILALKDAQWLGGIWVKLARDAALALAVLPLVKILFDQQLTIDMRKDLAL